MSSQNLIASLSVFANSADISSEPLRVLHITETTISGVRRHILSLLEYTNRQNIHCEIASPKNRFGEVQETGFFEAITDINVAFHTVEMHREIHPISDLRAIRKLVGIIRNGQFDIVHTHSSKAGIVGRFAAKLCGVKTVHTPNGFYFLGQHGAKRYLYLWIEKIAGLLTNRLIAVSQSEYDGIVQNRLLTKSKIVTIPNAIPIQEFLDGLVDANVMRDALGISQSAPIVGTTARYSCQKDPFTFVKAASKILEERPDVRFVWCGEGELRTETEVLAKDLGIHASFHFLGFRRDVRDIMNTFDIFALSSLFEGLPYTLLEAMTLRKPIVATDVVGSRDVIFQGQNGILVPSKSPNELASAMLKLLNSPQMRHEMGAQGGKIVRSMFGIEQMIQHVHDVYVDVARVRDDAV